MVLLLLTLGCPSSGQRQSGRLDEHKISQDLLDLQLLGLRLETKLTILESLVNRLVTSAQASQCPTRPPQAETEVATSDTQERILRAQQAIIDISNRNTVELEQLSQLVLTQTAKLANRSDVMLGLIKSSELLVRRGQQVSSAQPSEVTSTRRHSTTVDRHNL